MNYSLDNISYFTPGGSLMSPTDLVRMAKEKDLSGLALTDIMTISGEVEFFKACDEQELKGILGCKLRLYNVHGQFMLNVYVKNDAGKHDLMNLITEAYEEENFLKIPRVPVGSFGKALLNGNLLFSNCQEESIFKFDDCYTVLDNVWAKYFCPQIIQVACTPLHHKLNKIIENKPNWANSKYLHEVHQVLYQTAEQKHAADVHRSVCKMPTDLLDSIFFATAPHDRATPDNLLSASYMEGAFYDDYPTGDCVIANECDYTFKEQSVSLPKLYDDESKALRDKAEFGLIKRTSKPLLGYMPTDSEMQTYHDRLNYELQILEDLGFDSYFLLVEYVTTWCRENDILVGPGRGSVGGSLVAFALGITDVDPIRFDLIFERFINPGRNDLPDIDLDFMSTRRHEVNAHLIEKFGAENCATISNYLYNQAAGAVRSTGRVYGLKPNDMMPVKDIELGEDINEALKNSAYFAKWAAENDEIVSTAQHLQKRLTGYGQHAAGFVVAGEPIANRVVVERRKGQPVTHCDKRTVEKFGLVKMDFLGLSTLDILSICLKNIGKDYNYLLSQPLDDKSVLEEFSNGNTDAIFQLDGSGMRGVLRALAMNEPLTFEDVYATTALHRPGAMESGMEAEYIAIKQGMKEPFYDHPAMKAALEPTFGVIVYQEQVMKIAQDLCGFTLSEADVIRSAMGKKNPELMAAQKEAFVQGAIETSKMEEQKASDLFDSIDKFAGYGFNKSHAVSYTILSYFAMYLKVHHTAEFFAAALTVANVTGGDDRDLKMRAVVRNAKKSGIDVLPPDINISTDKFRTYQNKIYCSFNCIKGLSDKTAAAIKDARGLAKAKSYIDIKKVKGAVVEEVVQNEHYNADGKFDSLEGFEELVVARSCNKAHRAKLEAVGAFASLSPLYLPATHESRLKDQLELLPGIMLSYVKADRLIQFPGMVKEEIDDIFTAAKNCEDCDRCDQKHPMPFVGSEEMKAMVIVETPSGQEPDRMMPSGTRDEIHSAIEAAGLYTEDFYLTAYFKAKKETGVPLTVEQTMHCHKYVDQEIAALRPPVIIAMGASVIRHLVPKAKGNIYDLAGQTFYDKERECTIVATLSPGMVYFNPSAQNVIDEAFDICATIHLK